MGYTVREEVLTASGYSIDAVVEVGGRSLGIEFDGPSHFIGRTSMPMGATLLKRRQLHHDGWQLTALPYWEWAALEHKDAAIERVQRNNYLRWKLDEAFWSCWMAKLVQPSRETFLSLKKKKKKKKKKKNRALSIKKKKKHPKKKKDKTTNLQIKKKKKNT
eukprot:NODE_15913_length_1022_cov_4.398883.p2 GENE.NODE_15913_length_1022_cov_4.398883~~NODE_15913_length_1022_cov_4.398883.p2  ORF type:complete len:161 (+),score=69.39 NODE_15913_length_1022_cov_4.398883:535-1017(+)